MEAFEAWLLRRVTEAVQAGEVPADLLADLRVAIKRVRDLPPEEGHALVIRDIAKRLSVPMDRIEEMRAAFEALPAAQRAPLLRRLVAAWLGGQRRQSRDEGGGS